MKLELNCRRMFADCTRPRTVGNGQIGESFKDWNKPKRRGSKGKKTIVDDIVDMETVVVRVLVGKATKPSAKPKGMKTTPVTTPNTALSAVALGCNAVEALETTPHTGSP
jgi:hypothetical protein